MYISDRVDGWLLYGETEGLFKVARLGSIYKNIIGVKRKRGDFTRIIGITHGGTQVIMVIPKELKIRRVGKKLCKN